MTLTEFLLARIAEDEAVAKAAGGVAWRKGRPERNDWGLWEEPHEWDDYPDSIYAMTANDPDLVVYEEGRPGPNEADHIARHHPARVLAECDAKRRIVELDARAVHAWIDAPTGQDGTQQSLAGLTEHLFEWLALPYADHPDYREEWRP